MGTEDADEIRSKKDELAKAMMKIGTELTKNAGGGPTDQGATPEPEVKDAEYEEPKKDDKKE